MRLTINHKPVDVEEKCSILQAITSAHEKVLSPELGIYREWIKNKSCPLLGLAEVNGVLVPLPMLNTRPACEGMEIFTDSQSVKDALAARADLLINHNECHFIKEWQKIVAAEAENAKYIVLEEWEDKSYPKRITEPAIIHDPAKCIRCQACVETCNDVQKVGALSFDQDQGVLIDEKRCVRCGQCIHHCPTGATHFNTTMVEFFQCNDCPFSLPRGAMRETDDTIKAWNLLHNPERYCVTEFAPAIRASLGEGFGIAAGELVTGKLYAALRRLGFKKIWDTNFAADLTIMEEGSEFIDRLTNGGVLPMFTSCSPGWILFVEKYYPELIPHLSSAKSPQQMFGAIAKSFGAKLLNIPPESMAVISFMPCTAKKAEAKRPEMNSASLYWAKTRKSNTQKSFQDVDLVLTTRELARLIKMAGIDLKHLPEDKADDLLGYYTGAATIFGRTGGVMEAALRTVIAQVTGRPPASLEFDDLGSKNGIKKSELKIKDNTIKVAVAHGLDNARIVCESVKTGGEFSGYHFIEVMTCPGGCIAGGGQPIPTNRVTINKRTVGLNHDDKDICTIRMSHENPEIKELYRSFLDQPLGHIAHSLLHTKYEKRPLN
jgi:iron-only hydrogenase group A